MNARGFTLLELMVGGAVGVFAVTLILGVFISQNASFQSLDLVRQMNANARDASLELENSLKRAGYGIDPNLAFDFTCPGQPAGTKCHDSYNGTDDLKFYARNPNYQYTPQNAALGCNTVGGCLGGGAMWKIVAAPTSTSITATLGSLDTIQKGRIVMAVCADSTHPVYATVTSTGPLSGPGNIAMSIAITASTSTSLVGDTAFNVCHTTGYLMLVDQYHYYVTTLNNEPWLVLDTGIVYDAVTASNNLIPVARGVEDFQVAYLLGVPFVSPVPTAPDSNTDWIVGNNAANAAIEEPNPAAALTQNGAANGSLHPGNIRGVRISMVLRSPIPDRSLGSSFLGDPAVKFENRSDVSGVTLGLYRRMPITLSVATRNMGSANPYLFF
jgi:type IV pilus assembly protein PilW